MGLNGYPKQNVKKTVKAVRLPFPFPVFPDLWVERDGPGHKVNPSYHLVNNRQSAAGDDYKADPCVQARLARENRITVVTDGIF